LYSVDGLVSLNMFICRLSAQASKWIREKVKFSSADIFQSERVMIDLAMFDTTSEEETGSDKP